MKKLNILFNSFTLFNNDYKNFMKVWILTDDRIGSANQSMGLAEFLVQDKYITKKIVYNNFVKLPNILRKSIFLGVDFSKSDKLGDDYPDLVIFAGRRLAPVALDIKKKSQNKTKIVCNMHPSMSLNGFDFVVLPEHDGYKGNSSNVLVTNGSINRVKTENMKKDGDKWKKALEKLPKPYVGFLIGGDTKSTQFPPEEFGKLTKQLSKLTKDLGGSLLITTSRRTGLECLAKLKANLNCPYYLYDWNDENKKAPKDKNPLGNPYFAYMGLSDYLVATCDSMSMVSEACSTGKPVYVYKPEGSGTKKHFRFSDGLIKNGFVKEITTNTKKLIKYKYEKLIESKRIAELIRKQLKEKK